MTLQNASFLAIVAVHTAENEQCEVWDKERQAELVPETGGEAFEKTSTNFNWEERFQKHDKLSWGERFCVLRKLGEEILKTCTS